MFEITSKLSPKESWDKNSHEISNPTFWKNKRKYFKVLSAEFVLPDYVTN